MGRSVEISDRGFQVFRVFRVEEAIYNRGCERKMKDKEERRTQMDMDSGKL